MKLSSLNKFKGKKVDVEYWNDEEKCTMRSIGTVEEVEEDGLTIETDTSLEKIPISAIQKIEMVE